MSDSSRPHGLQPTRLLHPWDFPGKSAGVGCHCLLHKESWTPLCILNQKWQMITSVDLKQIDRQIFFLAKMGLFKISRKLLFDICDQEDPHESYWTARESELLYRGKGSWEGCSKQRVHGSSLAWVLARKEEESFFCLLGSATVPEHDSSLFQAPGLYLIEVSVYECLTHPTLKRI